MITSYDAPFARIVDAAGVDAILVGDSVAQVVLGQGDTLHINVEDIARHVAAVAQACPRALVVSDMPWLSYHVDAADTVRNAAALVRAGAQAVKLEGGRNRVSAVRAIVDAEIPVMGHLGLTPQSVHVMGGYKVQGREISEATELCKDADALASAGCFAIVLEGVPDVLATRITAGAQPGRRAEVRPPICGFGRGRN
jgi:3-methyl-2-oxobutanoate hydroxymethyltransferase